MEGRFFIVGQNIGLVKKAGEEKRIDSNNIHLWSLGVLINFVLKKKCNWFLYSLPVMFFLLIFRCLDLSPNPQISLDGTILELG